MSSPATTHERFAPRPPAPPGMRIPSERTIAIILLVITCQCVTVAWWLGSMYYLGFSLLCLALAAGLYKGVSE